MKKGIILGIVIIILIILGVGIFCLKLQKDECSVKFLVDDKVVAEVKTAKGKTITIPSVAVKEGYEVSFWLYNNNIFYEQIKINEDMELKAYYVPKNAKDTVNVTYDLNGGKGVKKAKFKIGDKLLYPVKPTKENTKFKYWSLDNNKKINKEVILKKDMTIYAIWDSSNQQEKEVEKKNNINKKTTKQKDSKIERVDNEVKPTDDSSGQKTDYETAVYACPDGYVPLEKGKIKFDTICIKYQKAKVNYICPSEFVGEEPLNSNSKCYNKEDVTELMCPEGYTESEEKCCNNNDLDLCEDQKDKICPDGYELTDDNKCMLFTKVKIKYTCDSGLEPSGSMCNSYKKAQKQ